jgi:hypothetical protein
MKRFSFSDAEEMLEYASPAVQELSALPAVNTMPKNGIVIVTDPANPLSKVVYMNSGKYWIVLSSSSVFQPVTPGSPPAVPSTPSSAQPPRVFSTAVVAGVNVLVTIPTPFPSPFTDYPYNVAAFLTDGTNFQVVIDPGDANKTPSTINFPDIQFSGTLHVFALVRN